MLFITLNKLGNQLTNSVSKEKAWYAAYRSTNGIEVAQALENLFEGCDTTEEMRELVIDIYKNNHIDDYEYAQLLDSVYWYGHDGNFYRCLIVRFESGFRLHDD